MLLEAGFFVADGCCCCWSEKAFCFSKSLGGFLCFDHAWKHLRNSIGSEFFTVKRNLRGRSGSRVRKCW